MKIEPPITFADHIRAERLKKRQVSTRITNKDISKPARMVLLHGANFQNLISACLEVGYYRQYELKKRK